MSFTIPHSCHVGLQIFDVSGKLVSRLVDEYLEAGKHTAVFDAHSVASGIYYYCLEAAGIVQTRSCVVVK